MLTACPHCGYPVPVAQGGQPERCPKCDGLMSGDKDTAAPAAFALRPGPEEAPRERRPIRREGPASATGRADPASAATPGPADQADPSTPPAGSRVRDYLRQRAGQRPPPPAPMRTDVIPADAVARAAALPPAASAFPPGRPAPPPPRFARLRDGAREHRRLRIAISVLSVVLVLQILLAKHDDMAATARWRPLATVVCALLFCDLPPWHEPTAFSLVHRNVRPHATTPGVLSVSASFRNDARWPQAWPTLILSLSDVEGRQVGLRSFRPEEYRPPGAPEELAPGHTTQVQFDVIEPAPRIVAFNFDFR